jgi:hypothetical protein
MRGWKDYVDISNVGIHQILLRFSH